MGASATGRSYACRAKRVELPEVTDGDELNQCNSRNRAESIRIECGIIALEGGSGAPWAIVRQQFRITIAVEPGDVAKAWP
jgi:hypothetical protein